MFVSQAHSFRQQARLAATLAWVGGYTNLVTFLACGTVTSHVSGTASFLGRDVFNGLWGPAGFAVFLLTMFFLGAAVSGFSTEFGRRRGWESIYVLPVIIEATLLGMFAMLLELWKTPLDAPPSALYWMAGLASAAMGLQNATITRISSGTVRTTHVTGVLTDLGHDTVQFLWWLLDRRRNVPPALARGIVYSVYTHPTARRLVLLASIFGTFILGGGLGSWAYVHFPRWAMFPPVAFLLWIIYQDVSRPIAEMEPSTLVNSGSGLALPAALAVFHLRKDHDRRGRVHRMPNLLAWSERLPTKTKVVVLDLAEVTALDANASLELRALVTRFQDESRELIIAGLDQARFRQIHLFDAEHVLHPDNVCPDFELAVARGLNLLEQMTTRSQLAPA